MTKVDLIMFKARRNFLKMSALGLAGVAVSPVSPLLAARARADVASFSGKSVVTIFLRGGADGLEMVFPTGPDVTPIQQEAYRKLRNFSLQRGFRNYSERQTSNPPVAEQPLQLDGYFELHPSLQPLHGLFGDGKLAIIPGVGGVGSRSHFSAQDAVEWGSPAADSNGGSVKMTGWMHDSLVYMVGDDTLPSGMLAGGISFGPGVAKSLDGVSQQKNIFAINTIKNFKTQLTSPRQDFVEQLYAQYHQHFADSGNFSGVIDSTRSALSRISAVQSLSPTVDLSQYPVQYGFSEQLAGIAAIINAGTPPAFFSVDFGGWDTHEKQRTTTTALLKTLANNLLAFYNDLNNPAGTCVLVISEFGRTLDYNGNDGTEHGEGGTWLILGGGVNGGVYADGWNGLPNVQTNGDGSIVLVDRQPVEIPDLDFPNAFKNYGEKLMLNPAVDYRSLYQAVLQGVLGLPAAAAGTVFGQEVRALDGLFAAN